MDPASQFIDYSARDREIVDYDFYQLPDVPGLKFRGPRPELKSGEYFSCIGSSQTLGVLAAKPFPTLLSEELDMPVLNLGLGGATPAFYGSHKELIEYTNNGKFLILQVMAARGEPNSRFQESDKIEHLYDLHRGDEVSSFFAWGRALKEEPGRVPLYMAESRNSWVRGYLDILSKVKVPVILFFFSHSDIDTPINLQASNGVELLGGFPQLVDRRSLEIIKELSTKFVSCRSKRNQGHPYISRFTGKPVEIDYSKLGVSGATFKETHNDYYHTDEMNEDAVPELLAAIRTL